MPAEYMFKEIPEHELRDVADPVVATLSEMDRHGIDVGLVNLTADPRSRSGPCVSTPTGSSGRGGRPNEGMDGIRKLVRAHEEWGVRAAAFIPHGVLPQVPINTPLAYVLYAKCVELGIPVFVTVGVARPSVPSLVQHVELVDRVMYEIPGPRVRDAPWCRAVGRPRRQADGQVAHPVLLDFGVRARYYPQGIMEHANTRGADRVVYGGLWVPETHPRRSRHHPVLVDQSAKPVPRRSPRRSISIKGVSARPGDRGQRWPSER